MNPPFIDTSPASLKKAAQDVPRMQAAAAKSTPGAPDNPSLPSVTTEYKAALYKSKQSKKMGAVNKKAAQYGAK